MRVNSIAFSVLVVVLNPEIARVSLAQWVVFLRFKYNEVSAGVGHGGAFGLFWFFNSRRGALAHAFFILSFLGSGMCNFIGFRDLRGHFRLFNLHWRNSFVLSFLWTWRPALSGLVVLGL